MLMISLWTRSFFFAPNLCVQLSIGCLHLDGLGIFSAIYIKFNSYLTSWFGFLLQDPILVNTISLVTQFKGHDVFLDLLLGFSLSLISIFIHLPHSASPTISYLYPLLSVWKTPVSLFIFCNILKASFSFQSNWSVSLHCAQHNLYNAHMWLYHFPA